MSVEEILSSVIALACVAAFLALYCGIVSWAINDAHKRGKTGCTILILFWLFGPLAVIVWLIARPPMKLIQRQPESYADPDEALAAASRLDMLGDWNAAIAIYHHVAARWPEHQPYSAACVQRIKEKQSLA